MGPGIVAGQVLDEAGEEELVGGNCLGLPRLLAHHDVELLLALEDLGVDAQRAVLDGGRILLQSLIPLF